MASPNDNQPKKLLDNQGWDGKLRVEKKASLLNPEALSDPEYSDDDAPPVEEIAADEGNESECRNLIASLTASLLDLLDDYDLDTEVRLPTALMPPSNERLSRKLISSTVAYHQYQT